MLKLPELQTTFQKYLKDNIFTQTPQELYQPVNYILKLGGKRLRPIILLMSYNLFEETVVKALPAAFAIEIFHNFSLLHDDIMDEAPLRRGQPTVHIKYDVNTGILSGDVMLIYAYQYILELEDQSHIPDLMRIFNKVAIEVCEGQQYDMNFETTQEVKIADYLKMIELKTSVLIAGAMKMGAVIANAPEKDAQHLYEFGKNIGIAFQLQDDILDTFGDPEKFGKKVGGDIAQNKKTYLLLRAMELAKGSRKQALSDLITADYVEESTKIKTVTQIYTDLGIREDAEKLKEKYLEKAFRHLNEVEVPSKNKKELNKLANELMGREV